MDLFPHRIRGAREINRLRGHFIEYANWVKADYSTLGPVHILILQDPQLTQKAIEETWHNCLDLLKNSITDHMRLLVVRTDHSGDPVWNGYPSPPTDKEKELLDLYPQPKSRTPNLSFFEILRILLIRWLGTADTPGITMTQLGNDTGYSYKTVRAAVDKLSENILRFRSGSVVLESFPEQAWATLLLESQSLRETQRYYTREAPKTPDSMLSRFRKIPRIKVEHVAIGGVGGARDHADIDLIGMPRLDFTVHCPDGNKPDLNFLKSLDPGLELVSDSEDPASVVIHMLRRPSNYFYGEIADPIECLLDLHEMRLEAQAKEFLNSFKPVL